MVVLRKMEPVKKVCRIFYKGITIVSLTLVGLRPPSNPPFQQDNEDVIPR